MNIWKQKSFDVMNAEIARMRTEGIVRDQKLTPEEKEIFKRRIDAVYPFGERKRLPYKQWLEARKQIFYLYGCLPPLKVED